MSRTEVAARFLCRLKGRDPDSLVLPQTPLSLSGKDIRTDEQKIPAWRLHEGIANELIALLDGAE